MVRRRIPPSALVRRSWALAALGATLGACTGGSAGTTGSGNAGSAGAGTTGTAGSGSAGSTVAGTTGTAGSSGGGPTGVAGGAGTGAGSGGAGAAGGGAGGGATPPGPGLTDLTTFTTVSCTIAPIVTPASAVPMVGIATFTTTLAGADRAVIQFGKTSAYTLEAPASWADATHRTLLLGMPGNTVVHYRVVIMAGQNACVGQDATYMTGTVSGAPANQTPQKGPSAVTPAAGFIIAQSGTYAYIVNTQGEVVWAHKFPVGLSRALMSFDGNYMYGRDVGPFDAGVGGNVYRVGMDGSGEMKLTLSGGTHHDLTVTPTGIAYPAKQATGACDSIYVAGPDGSSSRPLVDLDVVFGKFALGAGAQAQEKCHVNAIRYYKDTDTFSVSDREKDAIAFISSKGEVLGSIGATPIGATPNHAKAEGADSKTTSLWRVQHGHDQYAPDKIVLWSNGVPRAPLHDQRGDGEARLAVHRGGHVPHLQRRSTPGERQLPRDQQHERRGPGDRSRPATRPVVERPGEGRLHVPPSDALWTTARTMTRARSPVSEARSGRAGDGDGVQVVVRRARIDHPRRARVEVREVVDAELEGVGVAGAAVLEDVGGVLGSAIDVAAGNRQRVGVRPGHAVHARGAAATGRSPRACATCSAGGARSGRTTHVRRF
jgi:hypothetical protein